jgi:protein DJ-1
MSEPRALVLLANGAEEMEVSIVVDVLRRGGVQVVVAGIDGPGPVTCSRGLVIVPDQGLAGCARDEFAAVVLPGGAEGARRLGASAGVGAVLRAQADAGRLVAAICAAPSALAAHGIGAGAAMTCHPSVRAVVAAHADHRADRVVADGAFLTSQGPGTAFEFALAIVARLVSPAKAGAVAGPLLLAEGSQVPG